MVQYFAKLTFVHVLIVSLETSQTVLSNLARFSAEEGEDDVDSNVEYEDDVFGDEIDDMNEKYELHSNTVLEVITVNGATALFSSSTSLELFYL